MTGCEGSLGCQLVDTHAKAVVLQSRVGPNFGRRENRGLFTYK
jgi:hypothetical protein